MATESPWVGWRLLTLQTRMRSCGGDTIGYHEIKNRQPSARARRDEVMDPVVRQLWGGNHRVYGAREVRRATPSGRSGRAR